MIHSQGHRTELADLNEPPLGPGRFTFGASKMPWISPLDGLTRGGFFVPGYPGPGWFPRCCSDPDRGYFVNSCKGLHTPAMDVMEHVTLVRLNGLDPKGSGGPCPPSGDRKQAIGPGQGELPGRVDPGEARRPPHQPITAGKNDLQHVLCHRQT